MYFFFPIKAFEDHPEKRQEFLQASSGQLEKLDFLMQAMIKTSRLETASSILSIVSHSLSENNTNFRRRKATKRAAQMNTSRINSRPSANRSDPTDAS